MTARGDAGPGPPGANTARFRPWRSRGQPGRVDRVLTSAAAFRPLVVAALLAAPVAVAGNLFDAHEPLDIILTGPLHTLSDNREDRTELPFRLEVDGLGHDIEVRVRGKSRLRVCRFMPMRLDFPRDLPRESPFAGQDKLKLATHCNDSKRSEADLLQEYLAYRIFAELSEVAFRVRLARVLYVDTDDRRDPLRHYAFLIESVGQLAERVHGEPAEVSGVSLARLEDNQAAIMYVFQYLVGNTDWSLVAAEGEKHCCHNGKLVDIDSKLYYVPYDFDLSGLVDARYARPDPSLRMQRVTTRRYRGFCTHSAVLAAALDRVLARRRAILDIADTLPDPGERVVAPAKRYLEGFFETAADRQRLLEKFERHCLGD